MHIFSEIDRSKALLQAAKHFLLETVNKDVYNIQLSHIYLYKL